MNVLRPYDREALRAQFRSAQPFPFIAIEEFLEPEFAQACAAAVPTFEESRKLGREFSAVNEKRKVQITDSKLFPDPIAKLHETLCSKEWLDDLAYITGIPNLLADAELTGGGIHVTGPRGRLDVHVDFNYVEERDMHRRLNILVYLNPVWEEKWGGAVELWDTDVTRCEHAFTPLLNRCVIFETSNISFHGVSPVTCPDDMARKSFAAYYYTKEAPAHWTGEKHTTIFKSRPNEKVREALLLPAERLQRTLKATVDRGKGKIKRLVGLG